MKPSQPTPVAVAVVRHADQVLIGKRPPGVSLSGLWEFPGGKVADGETPGEAAARECLEETGLAIRVGSPYLEVIYSYPHGRLKIRFLAAEPVDPAQPPREPFRWVPLWKLPDYRFPPANDRVIALLMKEDG